MGRTRTLTGDEGWIIKLPSPSFIRQCHRLMSPSHHHNITFTPNTRVSSMNFDVGCIKYSSLSSLLIYLLHARTQPLPSALTPSYSREMVASRDSVLYHPFPWSFSSFLTSLFPFGPGLFLATSYLPVVCFIFLLSSTFLLSLSQPRFRSDYLRATLFCYSYTSRSALV
jgi:hypothetical protein